MRKIPGIKPGACAEYVPVAFNNHLEPEPVKVFIRVPSQGEKREHLLDILNRVTVDKSSFTVTHKEILARKELALKRFVDHVENYADAGDVLIKTADDLWERGEEAISSEVYAQIEKLLSLDDDSKKDSSASSSSSPPVTTPSDGIAANALPVGTTSGETAVGNTPGASGTSSPA